jgi:iron complex transport system ATP-binding protein
LNKRQLLQNVSFRVGTGECVGLLGTNGAGKTTLMRAALGVLSHEGSSSIAQLPSAERARKVAWMSQNREVAWPVSVETLVMLGRIPYMSTGQRPKPNDAEKVNSVLKIMHLEAFRKRTVTHLSGGEQARVLIARMLAQDTPLIMADEPISGLDPAHQISTMQIFLNLAKQGKSVIVSLHDLGLAARYCTRLILLSEGKIVADGLPTDVLTADRLAEVFGIRAFYEKTEVGSILQPIEVL